jgi:diguanylate cyclase (GGDEF)-like protein
VKGSAEERAQRDRRLIQRTAALLSEDYPLDQLVSRLCSALSADLEVELAVVALSLEGDQALRVAGSAGARAQDVAVGSQVADTTASHAAFVTGTPLMLSTHDEVGTYSRGCWSGAASVIAVPIAYGDRALGVLAVFSAREHAFDELDLRLLQAIGRYLGIAVRNQRAEEPPVRLNSGRWLPYAVTALAVILLTAGVWSYVQIRTAQLAASSRAFASSRLAGAASNLSNHIDDSSQLAVTATMLFTGMPHDRSTVESTLTSLLQSAQSKSIFGVGVWYQPNSFAPGVALYGPYATRVGNGPVRVTYQWMSPAYDFPSHPWYRLGIAAAGNLAYTEPYFDTDYVYVSAVRAFRDARGRIAGVVTVDSILQQYEQVIGRSPMPRSLLYVRSPSGQVIMTSEDDAFLAFARIRGVMPRNVGKIPPAVFDEFLTSRVGDDQETFTATLPTTQWVVALAVDRNVLFADVHRFRAMGVAVIGALWALTLLVLLSIWYLRRQAGRSMEAARRQIELTREVAERKKAEERLRERAFRDELTRLPNRAFLIGELGRALGAMRVAGEGKFALLFIDLDRFNVINDSLGHDTGDLLLAEIAHRLHALIGASGVAARLGGDEFVLLVGDAGQAEAVSLAERILDALRNPFSLSGHELFVSASVGIALGSPNYALPEEVLRDADAAMYEAKRAGRSTYRIFDQTMHARALEALSMETDLRWALTRNEIYAVYQPIISLSDGRIAGFEALARWKHPTRGIVSPDSFIELAEHTGLIVDIDERILSEVCAQTRDWLEEFPDLYFAVNASAAHLARVDDLAGFRRIIDAAAYPSSSLRIELTETAVMESRGKAEEIFGRLRELGIGIMVDDFGTGYSSLGYLQRLPIEGLKVDRSFVNGMMHDEKASTIVLAIQAIAQALRLRVICEGVERREELDRLRAIGIEYAQGFFFSPGVEAEKALEMLRAEPRTELKRSLRV